MDVYYHCSYTGSPVGFQLGKLTCEKGKALYDLDGGDIPPLVRRCFDQRAVRRACQYAPDTRGFLLLVKGLSAKGTEGPAEYYINFALAADREEDFQSWLSGKGRRDVSDQDIADLVRDSMELDPETPFGFRLRGEKVTELVGLSLGGQFGPLRGQFKEASDSGREPGVYVYTGSQDTDPKKLQEHLGLPDPFTGYAEGWFRSGKKKRGRRIAAGVGLAAALLLSLLAALFFSR